LLTCNQSPFDALVSDAARFRPAKWPRVSCHIIAVASIAHLVLPVATLPHF
jgi:hypothetical protein